MDKLRAEWDRLKVHVGSLGTQDSPMEWRSHHCAEFPLLGKYWLANSSFPATSASAERAFNMDGLIFTSKRFAPITLNKVDYDTFRVFLDPERGDDMLVCKDYWHSHVPLNSFTVCAQCPPPPSPDAQYVIQCTKHNRKFGQ